MISAFTYGAVYQEQMYIDGTGVLFSWTGTPRTYNIRYQFLSKDQDRTLGAGSRTVAFNAETKTKSFSAKTNLSR